MSSTINQKRFNWAHPAEQDVPVFEQANPSENYEETIEERIDENMNVVKFRKKVIRKKVIRHVHPLVKKRMEWTGNMATFDNTDGLEPAFIRISEEVPFKLSLKSDSDNEMEEEEENEKLRKLLAAQQKATLIDKSLKAGTLKPMVSSIHSASLLQKSLEASSTPGKLNSAKYVPPSLRREGSAATDSPFVSKERRDEMNTLRITNLSLDATEADLKELVQKFGATSRVYVARDREANICKGFAFVSYQSRRDAEYALKTLDGYGYDSLILRVEWANPKD